MVWLETSQDRIYFDSLDKARKKAIQYMDGANPTKTYGMFIFRARTGKVPVGKVQAMMLKDYDNGGYRYNWEYYSKGYGMTFSPIDKKTGKLKRGY